MAVTNGEEDESSEVFQTGQRAANTRESRIVNFCEANKAVERALESEKENTGTKAAGMKRKYTSTFTPKMLVNAFKEAGIVEALQ